MCYLGLENISKTYTSGNEPVTAVSEVSLSVERGEFVAITGPSGCGKSTLLHIIGGLNRPSGGSVYVEGKSLYQQKAAGLALYRRRRVGIVYQFYNLVPELTARENLVLPALMDHRKVKKAWVDQIFEILGLQDKMDCYPDQLSGGQQQKIALGRALVTRPPLLLADEPTGNLDSAKRDELLELLTGLNRQEEMTILLVTHDLDVARTARRRIHMSDGKIIKDEEML
ncbi:MAG: ABC transporter ATP-binding protein [Lachnospiraceae bacterium]|nr:ABC transporter ATP-binding protein [Lachnospiraceae bacterium]